MAEPSTKMVTAPVTGFSHVQLLVTDLDASERWYTTVLGLARLAADPAEDYVALRHPDSGMVVVLSRAGAERPTGGPLDHLAFAVRDRDALAAWADALATAGIDHDGVVLELGRPSLQLRDPDGTAVELVARGGRRDR
jgi:glyoxylase I family protein